MDLGYQVIGAMAVVGLVGLLLLLGVGWTADRIQRRIAARGEEGRTISADQAAVRYRQPGARYYVNQP